LRQSRYELRRRPPPFAGIHWRIPAPHSTFDIPDSTFTMTDIAIRVDHLSKLYTIGRS